MTPRFFFFVRYSKDQTHLPERIVASPLMCIDEEFFIWSGWPKLTRKLEEDFSIYHHITFINGFSLPPLFQTCKEYYIGDIRHSIDEDYLITEHNNINFDITSFCNHQIKIKATSHSNYIVQILIQSANNLYVTISEKYSEIIVSMSQNLWVHRAGQNAFMFANKIIYTFSVVQF